MPNIACMRPWLVFGWKTTWSARKPVSAATAARTRGSGPGGSSASSEPNRARASSGMSAASSSTIAAPIGPTRAKSR